MISSRQHKDKLLILVSRFPFPLDKGDKLRVFHQLKELHNYYDITLFAISDHAPTSDEIETVKDYCSELIIHRQTLVQKSWNTFKSVLNKLPFQVGYFYSKSAHKKIKVLIKYNSYKHVYCQLIRMSEYVKNEHTITKTLDYMDTLSAGIQRRIEHQSFFKRWLFKSEAKRLRSYESKMFDFFESHVIISAQDRHLILHPEAAKIECIPNGIDASFFEELSCIKTHDFVFVGNMSYAPNIVAVQYIHDKILPHFPNSSLLVSGSSPTAKLLKLAEKSEQMEITGWVDDIRLSYLQGKIFVAPMMIGTGMQNKLLEAMALGVPCITTPLANSPIKTSHNKEILVAKNEAEFVLAINRLLADKKLYQEISENAKDFVKTAYSWERTSHELRTLFNKLA